jgi:glycosyltransferase involved in cell wall biosynthesis
MSTQPSGPIEVLMVVDDDVIDRFGCVLRHLCVGMMDEPVRTTVLTRSARNIDDSVGPARVVRLPRAMWPWHRWGGPELLEELDLEPPHIVHCFSAPLIHWVKGWAAAWSSAIAVHLTDLIDVHQLSLMELDARVTAIATSPAVERGLLERRPEMRDWTRVVPIGIPAQQEAACLAQPDRIPAVVVTVPLTRDSGVDRLLHSLQSAIRAGQEVQLFLLWGGPAERRLRRLVEQLGIMHYVTFAGRMPDWSMLEEALQGADFYIMPGVRRRFTATRLTAMASGLAILAPSGTSEDYLIDGTTARLFDPDDPHQLTETWLALLDDRGAARSLAETALDYARAHHQASAMATAIASIYREILQSPAVA